MDTEVIKALVVSGMDSKALIAKAFAEIGDKADKIGVLNVSPDLLETLATGKKQAGGSEMAAAEIVICTKWYCDKKAHQTDRADL